MRNAALATLLALLAALVAALAGAEHGLERDADPAEQCEKASLQLVNDGMLTIGTDNPAYPPWFGGGEVKGSKWKINDPRPARASSPPSPTRSRSSSASRKAR